MLDPAEVTRTRSEQAIVGVGLTPQGRVFDHGYSGFAVRAVELALADAGLAKNDIDGLLVNPGLSWSNPTMASVALQRALGLGDLRLSMSMSVGGATVCAMVRSACQAIAAGLASTVACVFSDAPIKPPKPREESRRSSAYAMARGWDAAYGYFGVNPRYAMIAKRHMHEYGTTQDQLGAVAVAQRDWARDNPSAELRTRPLTLADYHASRWIAEPFHIHDCCLISNGGACVIVTDAARARDRQKQPIAVLGYGEGHPGSDALQTLTTGAKLAAPTAFSMAGLTASDVDVAELYDCYTFTVLVTLEDYGFCPKGESGRFIRDGAIAPGGRLPVNTGGGQLSSFYMWGMTPVSEGVIQARGQGGERQVAKHDVVLVSGNGGVLSTHSTLVLSPLPS